MDIFNKAEKGDTQAQYDLGCRYLKGQGVEADASKAVRWLREAAAQGHERAQVLLDTLEADAPSAPDLAQPDTAEEAYQAALRYAWGVGVPQDDTEALQNVDLLAGRLSDDALGTLFHAIYQSIVYDPETQLLHLNRYTS